MLKTALLFVLTFASACTERAALNGAGPTELPPSGTPAAGGSVVSPPPAWNGAAPLWPMDAHDAQNRSLAFVTGPRAPTVKWTAPVHAASLVVGADGTLYASDLYQLRAIDGRTGDVLWSPPDADDIAGNLGLGADGTIYYVSIDSALVARSPADGSLKWTLALPNLSEQLVVDGDRVYLSSSSAATAWVLYAVDATGTLRWQHGLEAEGYVAATGIDGAVLVWGERNWSLDANDGHEQWSIPTPLSTENGFVVALDGTLLQTDMDPSNTLRAMHPSDGSVAWSFAEHSDFTVGAQLVVNANGGIQLSDGDRYVACTPNGKVAWTLAGDSGFAFNLGAVVDAEGVTYAATAPSSDPQEELISIDATGAVAWTWQGAGEVYPLALGETGWLYVLDVPGNILNDASIVAFGP